MLVAYSKPYQNGVRQPMWFTFVNGECEVYNHPETGDKLDQNKWVVDPPLVSLDFLAKGDVSQLNLEVGGIEHDGDQHGPVDIDAEDTVPGPSNVNADAFSFCDGAVRTMYHSLYISCDDDIVQRMAQLVQADFKLAEKPTVAHLKEIRKKQYKLMQHLLSKSGQKIGASSDKRSDLESGKQDRVDAQGRSGYNKKGNQ